MAGDGEEVEAEREAEKEEKEKEEVGHRDKVGPERLRLDPVRTSFPCLGFLVDDINTRLLRWTSSRIASEEVDGLVIDIVKGWDMVELANHPVRFSHARRLYRGRVKEPVWINSPEEANMLAWTEKKPLLCKDPRRLSRGANLDWLCLLYREMRGMVVAEMATHVKVEGDNGLAYTCSGSAKRNTRVLFAPTHRSGFGVLLDRDNYVCE